MIGVRQRRAPPSGVMRERTDRSETMYTLVVVVGIVTPTACQSGPQAAADGSYRAFAVAGSGTVPQARMEIQGSSITMLKDTASPN